MTREEFHARVAAWRALPAAEKVRRRVAASVDEVIGQMAMEGQPVTAEWEARARAELAAELALL